MATSRTGTSEYKRWVAAVKRRAQSNGITHCPNCGTELDYTAPPHTEHSVEADHIIPDVAGGPTTLENGQVLCHPCNRRKGHHTPTPITPVITKRQW